MSSTAVPTINPDLKAAVDKLKTGTREDALNLVYKVMPMKIVTLSTLFDNPAFQLSLEQIKTLSLPEQLQPSFIEETLEPAKDAHELSRSVTQDDIVTAVAAVTALREGKAAAAAKKDEGAVKEGEDPAGSSSSSSSGSSGKRASGEPMTGSAELGASAAKKRKRLADVDVGTGKAGVTVYSARPVASAAEYPTNLRVPSNAGLKDILSILRKETLELIYVCNTVKLWVQLNIPRIEDGNNFGVGVQEEIVSELSRAEDSGLNLLESMTKYFMVRARIVAKALKYPQVEDYAVSIRELDEKEFITCKLCGLDLRNNYLVLLDLLEKNINRLTQPRSSSSMVTMY